MEASKQNTKDAIVAPVIMDVEDCDTNPNVPVEEGMYVTSTSSFQRQQVSALQASMDDNTASKYSLHCHARCYIPHRS